MKKRKLIKKRVSKTIWITRDQGDNFYVIHDKKPEFDSGCWTSRGEVGDFCERLFKKYTNVKLRGGSKSIVKGRFKFVKVR